MRTKLGRLSTFGFEVCVRDKQYIRGEGRGECRSKKSNHHRIERVHGSWGDFELRRTRKVPSGWPSRSFYDRKARMLSDFFIYKDEREQERKGGGGGEEEKKSHRNAFTTYVCLFATCGPNKEQSRFLKGEDDGHKSTPLSQCSGRNEHQNKQG